MGARAEAAPGRGDAPGAARRAEPSVELDERGFGKSELRRNRSRAQERPALRSLAWQANGDVGVLLLKSDPGSPDPEEIARVPRCALAYGCKGAETAEMQKQLWGDAVMRLGEQRSAKSLCANLLAATVARRRITKAECAVPLLVHAP